MNKKEFVNWLKDIGSFLHGDFVLASGQKANYYLDLKSAILTKAKLFADIIFNEVKNNAIAGYGLGGTLLVAASLPFLDIPGIIVRQEQKDHGTSKKIETHNCAIVPKVTLLEDVITTGGSAKKAISILQSEGFMVTDVFAIACRNDVTEISGIPVRSYLVNEDFGDTDVCNTRISP